MKPTIKNKEPNPQEEPSSTEFIYSEQDDLPFNLDELEEEETVPFGEDGATEDGEEDCPDRDGHVVHEKVCKAPTHGEQELMDCISTIVYYLKYLQLGLYRMGMKHLRFLPPQRRRIQQSILDDYDVINEVRWHSPGYYRFVKQACGGKDPLEDPYFKIALKDAKNGYVESKETYDSDDEWIKGQYSEVISEIEALWEKQAVAGKDSEVFKHLILRARYTYEHMVYEREDLLDLYQSLVKDRMRLHKTILALVGEVRYLYQSIRNTGNEVPLTGHSIDLSPLVSRDDPHRDEYQDEGDGDFIEDFMQGRYVGEEYFDAVYDDDYDYDYDDDDDDSLF